MNFEPCHSGCKWPKLARLEIVSTLQDSEYALTYAKELIKTDSFPRLRTICVVVKPNLPSNLEMSVLGDDWSDMSHKRCSPPNPQAQIQNASSHELDDKKFAEALFELKSRGVEVHVWFSGNEQFTKRARVM